MTKRKTVGWVVFAALMMLILVELPGVAARVCFAAGTRFYTSGHYSAAATAFAGAVLLGQGSARSHVELGSTYLALKKYAAAEKAFLKAKSLDDESCASCGLGMAYHGLGRHDDAEREFKHSISLNPSDVCPYRESGRMYYERGMYPEAIAAFNRTVSLEPSYGNYMYLGNAHVYARDYEPGVEAYKKAIELRPKDERVHYQLGIAYEYMRRFGDAAREFNETLKLDPEHESARYSLALAYVALHNKPAALEQYESLRKIDADSAAELLEHIGVLENRERGKEKLYFVPLNNFPAASLKRLVNSCKQKTGIDVIVTQPVPFVLSTVDKRRQQVIAEEAINLMKLHYPNLASDPNAVVIGLTDEDLFVHRKEWEWAFSYRMQGRFAVVSSARMNPASFGGAANDVLTESRLRKMVLKNIGALYYFMPLNHDPKSVLYEGVGSVADLDNMGEDF
ncbi:MAG TPA: tetratricopeptide repeat protein [Pyrinomonadaceae bacterium]|nr:tetratricopeptide repeat protein [Pyrinomonadaceae bacterium]